MKVKRRIIITIEDDNITDWDALTHVRAVVANGKESETDGIKQYCFVTTFQSDIGGVSKVIAREKRNINTDSFIVR